MLYQFDGFQFDTASGELLRDGTTTRLEPQPSRVLAVLLERASEVVSRSELQQRVWSDDTFVDFDRGLNYCISQIRTALGDSASEPRFIETLPRRGYRFLASIHDAESAPEPAVGRRFSGTGIIRQVRSRRALAATFAIGLVAAAAWTLLGRTSSARDTRVRIAVVPFDNETGISDYDRLAQSLTDATVARLARDGDRIAVIGNAAVLRAPRNARDLKAIGRELGAGHVVLGQIQQIGGQLRITSHLIRVDDQTHMWAQRFEPASVDGPALDREVSEAVAAAIAKRLLGG